MFAKAGVTVGDGSTNVTDVPGSRNEPDVLTDESGRQGNEDNQNGAGSTTVMK